MPDTMKRDEKRAFTFHTAGIRAVKSANAEGGNDMFLEGVASSTVRDRQGDTINANAQAQMVQTAKGCTMFLNHSYDVPEDIAGTCTDAALQTATAEGSDALDLTIRCKIDPENPRAVKVWKHVEGGTKLGFSIGGKITDASIDKENDDGDGWMPPLLINGLELMEISVVGIPANPRAYTRGFVEQIARSAAKTALRSDDVQLALAKSITGGTGVEGAVVEDEPELEIPAEVLNGDVAASAPVGHETAADPGDVQTPEKPTTETTTTTTTVTPAPEVEQKRAELADLEAKLAAARTEVVKISTDVDEQRRVAASLADAQKKLEDEIAKLKATPTGRQTKSYPGGSSDSSEAQSNSLESLMRKSQSDLYKEMRTLAPAEKLDARAAAALQ